MKYFGEGLVDGWTPATFAIAFVARLRQSKRISHMPSLRTTLAIPRFLTARYFRTGTLTPRDYIEGAVYNTTPEDQPIAEAIARELLFPRTAEVGANQVAAAAPPASPTSSDDTAAADATVAVDDPMASILGDLAKLDVNLEGLNDLSSLDALLDQQTETKGSFGAFDLFEGLLSSSHAADKSLGELIGLFGGPGELAAMGGVDEEKARALLRELLRGQVGNLSPEQLFHGSQAGFSELLLRETRSPWELAAALAGAGSSDLSAHLRDILRSGTARELGKTLQYLKPHGDDAAGDVGQFREAGLARAKDLSEFAEVLEGLGEWVDPPTVLVTSSAQGNIHRSLAAARRLETTFDRPLQAPVFEAWAAGLAEVPPLDFLLEVATPCDRWEELLVQAYDHYVTALDTETAPPPPTVSAPSPAAKKKTKKDGAHGPN